MTHLVSAGTSTLPVRALPPGWAAGVLVAAAALLAAVLVPQPGRRVLTGRLSPRPPEEDHHPGGGDGDVRVARSAAVPVALSAVVAAWAFVTVTGVDLRGHLGTAVSALGRSGLPGGSPALVVVLVVIVRSHRRTRRRRAAVAARASLIRGIEALLAELRAGASALTALAAAAVEVPDLLPVAAAAHLGGDVPTGLTAVARRPGLSGLGHLAAAWAVSAETGSSLTGTLDRLVDALRDAEEIRQETDVALATPRATARLLAVLPAAGLGLGTLVGADPWGFLTGSAAGAALAVVGALLAGAGLEWVEVLAGRVQDVGADPTPTVSGPAGSGVRADAAAIPGVGRRGVGRRRVAGR